MKRLVWEDDVEELDLGDGDFISISSSLSVKDMAGIQASAANPMDATISLLKAMVRGWRGPSFERNGEQVPATPENIGRLGVATAIEISNSIAVRINQARMDDGAKKESIENSSSTSVSL